MTDKYFLKCDFFPTRTTDYAPLSNTYLIGLETELETLEGIVKEVEGEVTQNREWEGRYANIIRVYSSWGHLKCHPTFLKINYKLLWDREKKVPDDILTRLRDVLDVRSDIQKDISDDLTYLIKEYRIFNEKFLCEK